MPFTDYSKDPLLSRFEIGTKRIEEEGRYQAPEKLIEEPSIDLRSRLESEGATEREAFAAPVTEPRKTWEDIAGPERTRFAKGLAGRFEAGAGKIKAREEEEWKGQDISGFQDIIRAIPRGVVRTVQSVAEMGDFIEGAGEAASEKVLDMMLGPERKKAPPRMIGKDQFGYLAKKMDDVASSRALRQSYELAHKTWDKGGISDPLWWVVRTSEAAPSMIGGMAGGVGLAKMSKRGAAAFNTLRAFRAGKGTRAEAVKAGKELSKLYAIGSTAGAMVMEGGFAHGEFRRTKEGKPWDPNVTFLNDALATIGTGVVAGGLEGVTNALHLGPLFSRYFGIEAKKVGTEFWKRLITDVPKHIAQEAPTEGAQEFIANVFKKLGYKPDQKLTEGVVEAMLIGGAMGGTVGVGGAAMKPRPAVEEGPPGDARGTLEAEREAIGVGLEIAPAMSEEVILAEAETAEEAFDRKLAEYKPEMPAEKIETAEERAEKELAEYEPEVPGYDREGKRRIPSEVARRKKEFGRPIPKPEGRREEIEAGAFLEGEEREARKLDLTSRIQNIERLKKPSSSQKANLEKYREELSSYERITEVAEEIEVKAQKAATSSLSVEPEPTEAQIEAGNYKKGHVRIQGLDISIENPKGSERKGTDPSGKEWSVTMKHHYGYIKGTVGKDKEHIDVFVGDRPESKKVFVVDQVAPGTTTFDEHKVIVGAETVEEAKEVYLSNYEEDWSGLGNITGMEMDQFKEWTDSGNTKKPFAPITIKKGEPAIEEVAEKEKIPPTKKVVEAKPVAPEVVEPSFVAKGKRRKKVKEEYYGAYQAKKSGLEGAKDAAGKPRQFYRDGFYSDGTYAVRTDKPISKHPLVEGTKAPDILAAFPKIEGSPARVLGEFHIEEIETSSIAHLKSEEGVEIFVNADLLDKIYTRYPSAKPSVINIDSPVIFKVDDEKVGMVMPLAKSVKDVFAKQIAHVRGRRAVEPIVEFKDVERRAVEPGIEFKGIERRVEERRVDVERRKRVREMSKKEMREELLINPVTNIPNKRAYQEVEQEDVKKGAETKAKAYIDADSLKYINDLGGHTAGDELLKTIAREMSGITDDSYHISGDEFILRAETEEQATRLAEDLNKRLAKAKIEFEDTDGKRYVFEGIGVSYGIHKEEKAADTLLRKHKKQREAEGARAARGEKPPGLREIGVKEIEKIKAKPEIEKPKIRPSKAEVPAQKLALDIHDAFINRPDMLIEDLENIVGQYSRKDINVASDLLMDRSTDPGLPAEVRIKTIPTARWLKRRAITAYSRAEVGKSIIKPTTKDQAYAEIASHLGEKPTARLLEKGIVRLVTPNEATTITKDPSAAKAQGFFHDGITYLVTDNIAEGKTWNVLLHELGTHHGYEAILGADVAQSTFNAFASKKDDDTPMGRSIQKAYRRVPEGTDPSLVDEEALAYFIEEKANKRLALWRQLIAKIKTWAIKNLGVSPDALTEDDYIAIAIGAVRKAGAPELVTEMKARGEAIFSLAGQPIFEMADVTSKAFKSWFGNSKIKNKKTGKPISLYHASDAVFWEFRKKELGKATEHPSSGLGFFFSPDKDMSAIYGTKVRKFFVKIERPYMMNAAESRGFKTIADASKFADDLQTKGYDGIVLKHVREFVVFDPTHIKSAELQTGAFDPSDPDVRYSMPTSETQQILETLDAKYPRYDIKYNGFQEGIGKTKGFHMLTPMEGPLRGFTMATREMTVAAIEAKFADKMAEVKEIVKYSMPEEKPLVLPGDITDTKVEDAEVQRQLDEARRGPEPTFPERAKEFAVTAVHSFTRHLHLLDPKRFGDVINTLRIFENVPRYSRETAKKEIYDFIADLSPEKFDVFTMNIILPDLLGDLDNGTLDPEEGLPFGYKTRDQVAIDLDKFQRIAQANPDIKKAVADRNAYMTSLKEKLVEHGLLREEVLENKNYYHHQVLEYLTTGKTFLGVTSKDVRIHKKGWQRSRTGSIKNYNTDYLESEFEVVAQGIAQIETQKALDRIEKKENVISKLRKDARKKNLEKYHEMIGGAEGEVQDVTNVILKETLGKQYATYRSEMPEGYTTWKPVPGGAFYWANTVTEKVITKLQEGMPLEESDIKQVLAKGRDVEWAIPSELAETMDKIMDYGDEALPGKVLAYTLTKWKQWILLNPFRVLKYNINNMSGDLDICFAYDSKIVSQYGRQAVKDLIIEYRGKPMSQSLADELKEAHRLDVIGSGWSVHELEDVKDAFTVVQDPKENLVKKYWRNIKNLTTFRENMLRLASWRYFKARLAEAEQTGEKIYAASKREEVDDIPDPTERAAKLSRELVGDYGNISHAGQWVRLKMIPFWSWCTPVDTEILTREGWKTHDQLTIGEEVLTYETDKRMTEWQPLEDYAVKKVDEPLVALTNHYGFKHRFTKDHRVVINEQYKNQQKIVLAKDLKIHHKIPLVAPHEFEENSLLSPSDAAVLGWIVTDGHCRRKGLHFESMIYQSPKNYAQEIREAFADYISSEAVHPDTGVIKFQLKADKTREISKVFTSYDDLPGIVTRLDKDACHAMYEAMMMGDGHDKGAKGISFAQKRQSAIDAFQILCYRLGMVFNIRPVKKYGGYSPEEKTIYGGYVRSTTKLSINKWSRTEEQYKGLVWCPQTKNKTWIMRQDGKVMITGNCEINLPRYVRLLRNVRHEGKGVKTIGGVLAWKTTKLGLKASILAGAVMAFNAMVFPEEEDELTESQRRQLHLILGRRSDGTIRTLRFQGALSDALSWFGMEDVTHDVKDVLTGKRTVTDLIQDAGVAPAQKIVQGINPFGKTLYELAMGKQMYPDFLAPRPIRDRYEHMVRMLSLQMPYRWAMRRPSRGVATDVASIALYYADPGQAAYYNTRSLVRDYLEKCYEKGLVSESKIKFDYAPTKRSNALYYYKQSLKYGDLNAADRYLKKYEELGGTWKGLRQSIRLAHPLSRVPARLRPGFMQSLDAKEKRTYNSSILWYTDTYIKNYGAK